MKNKKRILLAAYWAPTVVAILRVLLTIYVLVWNPLELSLRFIQVICIIIYGVTIFTYMKLFSDGDPIVLLLFPSIAHFLLIFGFRRVIQVVPFLPLVITDIVFLFLKGMKSTLYPFEVEGDEEMMEELELLGDE